MRGPGRLTCAAVTALTLAASARAAECPVDGARLTAPAPRAWNAGAGVDSDGCTWSITAQGRRVADSDALACPRCGAAFAADGPLPGRLPPDAAASLLAALAGAAPPESAARRLERAAEVRAALGAGAAEVGALLLRAAWAARAQAAGPGPDGGYRPRTVPQAREQLRVLEERARRGGDQDPAASHLEAAAGDLDLLRRALDGLLPAVGGPDLIAVVRARQLVGLVERRVLEAQAHLAVTPSEAGLELVLARAWARFGDPERRERWLEAARARHGEAVAAEAARLRAACAEEARLLAAARARFEQAAARADAPSERARLLVLAGDAARRVGDAEAARRLLGQAIEADPDGRLADVARALLER
ncbi:MAG: hypothetical protein M9894_11010 [Planctomycetes bacterium]|nr:hypothetical protein [Planctomycetota bacterium]